MQLRRDLRTPAGCSRRRSGSRCSTPRGSTSTRSDGARPRRSTSPSSTPRSTSTQCACSARSCARAGRRCSHVRAIEDAARPGRVIGFGSTSWAVQAPTPPGFVYVDPGPGVADVPDLPPLIEAFDVEPRPGGGYVLAGLSARVGADSLHQGPIQVMLEAAALDVARDAAEHRCDLRRAHRCDARAARQDRPLRRDRIRAVGRRAHRRLSRGTARRRRRRACRRDRASRSTDALDRLRGAGRSVGGSCPNRNDGSRSTTCGRCARSCRRPRINRIHDVAEPRAAATLVPIVDVDGEAAVVLTKRPATMVHHRGDWVFPGRTGRSRGRRLVVVTPRAARPTRSSASRPIVSTSSGSSTRTARSSPDS